MNIEKQINKIPLPKEYRRTGKKCFLDPYRMRLIEITPEEIVRQKTAAFFEGKLCIPHEMIALEVPMVYYAENVKGRADIIIHTSTDDGLLKPIAIIECKNSNVPLTDTVSDQAMNYADITGADYVFITNGIELFSYKYDAQTDRYIVLESIPTYKMMRNGEGIEAKKNMLPFVRFSLDELNDIKKLDKYNDAGAWIYGSDTPASHKPVLINLFQALFDSDCTIPHIRTENYRVVNDLGLRFLDYSNNGGGHFTGDYRSILIEDSKGDSQIFSISLFGTDPYFREDETGGRTSRSVLFVAVDRFKTSKPVLQLNLDAYMRDRGNYFEIVHDGKMSRIPSADVLDFVSRKSNRLIGSDGLIHLGKLPKDRLITMQEDTDLIRNILDYAILRDEYRMTKTDSRKG